MTSAMVSPLSPLWAARSVAVVGATERVGSLGRLPIAYLQRYGFGGRILPVHPSAGSVLGLPAYVTVAAARDDRAGRPGDDHGRRAARARRDRRLHRGRRPVAIVMSSGFAETGAAGAALQDEVVRRARVGGLRLLGPNCIGAVGVATARSPRSPAVRRSATTDGRVRSALSARAARSATAR